MTLATAQAIMPPSIRTCAPVMEAAAGKARKQTSSATSAGVSGDACCELDPLTAASRLVRRDLARRSITTRHTHPAVVDALKRWTGTTLAIGADAMGSVNELACGEPGCPPRETVILVLQEGVPTGKLSIHKAMIDCTEDDIVTGWRRERDPRAAELHRRKRRRGPVMARIEPAHRPAFDTAAECRRHARIQALALQDRHRPCASKATLRGRNPLVERPALIWSHSRGSANSSTTPHASQIVNATA